MSFNNPTILVDADVLAYAAASSTEYPMEWEPGYYTWYTPFEETKTQILTAIDEIKDTFQTNSVVLCLTSPTNFRKGILPSYKGNRSDKKKPLVLKAVREWMISDLDAVMWDGLEGDDVMGILSTWKPYLDGVDKIILSPDKDMQQIPGRLCKALGEEVVEISEQEADYYHLLQTLTGDQTDGYAGCPSVGPVKAEKILSDILDDIGFPNGTAWPKVVAAYEKQGLTEDDALVQARVAKILRAEDYDFANRTPIPWKPN